MHVVHLYIQQHYCYVVAYNDVDVAVDVAGSISMLLVMDAMAQLVVLYRSARPVQNNQLRHSIHDSKHYCC